MSDDDLRCIFAEGTPVYTILSHLSRNRKTAWFDVACAPSAGNIVTWTGVVAQRLGVTHHADYGIKVPGGVECAETIVRWLSVELYGRGDALVWRKLR